MKKNKIIIVDFLAIVFRYAFAYKDIYNSNNFPIGAIYGFFNYLFSIQKRFKPKYIIVISEGNNSKKRRVEELSSYKANRPPLTDYMAVQIPIIIKMLKQLNIPFFTKEGLEADDTIASLVHLKKTFFEIIISTSDKDLFQLLCPINQVSILIKNKLFSTNEQIKEKIGIFPEQIPDFLALAGDASDGIPGLKSIGPKTAIKILEKFGNIQNLFQKIETDIEIRPMLKNILIQNKNIVHMYLNLVKLQNHLTDNEISILFQNDFNFNNIEFNNFSKELELNLL